MEKFIENLSEILEEEDVTLNDELASFESWDSLAILSIIALADEIVQTWLDTPFEGGRHQRRIDKIENVHKMKQGEK